MLLLNYLPEIILAQLLLISLAGNIWLLKTRHRVTKKFAQTARANIQPMTVISATDDTDPTLLISQPIFKTEADPLLDKSIIKAPDIDTAEIETPQGTVTLFALETQQTIETPQTTRTLQTAEETTSAYNTAQDIKQLLDQITEIEEKIKTKSETTA